MPPSIKAFVHATDYILSDAADEEVQASAGCKWHFPWTSSCSISDISQQPPMPLPFQQSIGSLPDRKDKEGKLHGDLSFSEPVQMTDSKFDGTLEPSHVRIYMARAACINLTPIP